MKLKRVSFVNVIQFGGGVKSLDADVQADAMSRGGEKPTLELTEVNGFTCVKAGRKVNGLLTFKHIPMTNVSDFELAASEDKKK